MSRAGMGRTSLALRSHHDSPSSSEDSGPSGASLLASRGTQTTKRSELGPTIEETSRHIGRVLAGRYRVDRHVASGTMGRVFEGTQFPLERPVAIKILKSSGALSDVRFKKRFCREASIAA